MKKILILTAGSRGDVQPYIALGKGLKSRGHTVRLATLNKFAGMAEDVGLEFAPLDTDNIQILDTPEVKRVLTGGMVRNIYGLVKKLLPILRPMLENAWAAAQGVDVIIFHPLALAGQSIAEKLEIPGIIALPTPLVSPTAAFASPDFRIPFNQGWLNRLSHQMLIGGAFVLFRKLVNPWRREKLNLGPAGDQLSLQGKPLLKLYGYSRHVLPIPPDWDATTQVTGYWFLESSKWQPPESLLDFLNIGAAPVYVGFGSMMTADVNRLTQIVLRAGQISRQRMMLATGWGGLAQINCSPEVYVLGDAPHDWLFPRMAAIVHHGGAGTTAATLLAQKTSVICPFSGDQKFWGRRMATLGVSPAIIPQKRLTAENLAMAITEAVSNPKMHQSVERLGQRIFQENGIARAMDIIEAQIA